MNARTCIYTHIFRVAYNYKAISIYTHIFRVAYKYKAISVLRSLD